MPGLRIPFDLLLTSLVPPKKVDQSTPSMPTRTYETVQGPEGPYQRDTGLEGVDMYRSQPPAGYSTEQMERERLLALQALSLQPVTGPFVLRHLLTANSIGGPMPSKPAGGKWVQDGMGSHPGPRKIVR